MGPDNPADDVQPTKEEWEEYERSVPRARIAEDAGLANHGEAADYFNRLILDLKKQLLGSPHDPITMERLEAGTRHVLELDQCRRPMRRY